MRYSIKIALHDSYTALELRSCQAGEDNIGLESA